MISRAASRTSSERPSATSLRPSISALSFSRVRSDAGILSIGVLLRRGRSPNRTSLISPIRRGCTPTLFPASLGLHLGVFVVVDELGFQSAEETLHWRIVPAVSLAGQRSRAIIPGDDPGDQQPPERRGFHPDPDAVAAN